MQHQPSFHLIRLLSQFTAHSRTHKTSGYRSFLHCNKWDVILAAAFCIPQLHPERLFIACCHLECSRRDRNSSLPLTCCSFCQLERATGCMTRLNQDPQSGSFDQNRFDRHSSLLTPRKWQRAFSCENQWKFLLADFCYIFWYTDVMPDLNFEKYF